jgi:hypothetical protein
MRPLGLLGQCLVILGMAMPLPAQELQGSSYDVPWREGRLEIDGRLSDPAWARAAWSAPFMDIRGPEYPTPSLATRVRLLWDSTYLYIGADIQEPHIWGTLHARDAIIYRDDDFEVFLDPDGDGEAYYEIEINALGTVLDLFLPKPYGRGGRAILEWDAPNLLSAVHLRGTLNDPVDLDTGWTVELAIPWADLRPPHSPVADAPNDIIGAPPIPGSVWRVNFSRVDWPLEIVPREDGGKTYKKLSAPSQRTRHPEENWVWAPQGVINMHLPEKWGFLSFLGPEREGRD